MSWTDERVERLKEYWAEGLSASQIAKHLGGVTRNAVIGKVHRLGLSHRTLGEAGAPAVDAAAVEVDAAIIDHVEAVGEIEDRVAAVEPALESVIEPEPAAEVEAEVEPEPEIEEAEVARVPEPARFVPVVRDATQPRAPGLPTPEEEAARVTLAEIEKMARRLDLMELTERTCKWPIGDPAEDGFHFCGLPSVDGKPYCKHHVQIAFQPMSTRRDRSRASR